MEPIEYQRMAELEADFWWYRALHRASSDWITQLGLPEGAPVLDAGCGTGGLLQKLLNQHPGMAFSGLEFDADAARIATDKTGLPIYQGSIQAVPFADNTLQAIISNDVLCQETVDEASALAECFRCLSPGGHLLLNLPAYEWLRSSHDTHVHSVRRYTCKRLSASLKKAGFTIHHCHYRHGLLLPLMALHRLTIGKSKSTSDVEPVANWLNQLLYAITSLEQGFNNRGIYMPWGGSVTAWAIKP